MRLFNTSLRVAAAVAALALFTSVLPAADKSVMHCFAFTAKDSATEADWKAFHAATDDLPKKMSGVVKKVWYGKLERPLAQFSVDAEARKKLAGGEAKATGEVSRVLRQYGVCMELNGLDGLKAYREDKSGGHKAWADVYDKVRVPGTTTYDIIGQ